MNKNSSQSIENLDGLPPFLSAYREILDVSLREAVSEKLSYTATPIEYHMGWSNSSGNPIKSTKGKRLRPALMLFACLSLGGKIESVLPPAVAIELVHNFSLIHDDIEDRDIQRHNRPTVWSIWGEPKAIHLGSILYDLAFLQMKKARGIPPERLIYASSRLSESSFEMMKGQYLDISFEGRAKASTKEYIEMIAFKTASLIACALDIGVFIGTGNCKLAASLALIGRQIGQLFQIRDDILGIWGDVQSTGKPVGADIRRKKKSFPIVYAMEVANKSSAVNLNYIFSKPLLDDRDVEKVLDTLDNTNAKSQSEATTQQIASRILKQVERAKLPSNFRIEIKELVDFLVTRAR
ncbi:MAG: geranylgeranyl diphosphate synthase, type I [Chloroflexi bacterium]|nr:MAG: geranylgeranyl diphosphate synthase, type I [Chloroflexota bacterium]